MLSAERKLEPIRIAVALAHCLPECSVELSTDAGGRAVVGFQAEASMSPCLACSAVIEAMRTSADELGPLLGLGPGCPRARLLDEGIDDSHVGLGVYRHRDSSSWGYVFATLLSPKRVGAIVLGKSATTSTGGEVARAADWHLYHDERIAVTVCASSYPLRAASLLPVAERLALDLAEACLVEELVTPA